MTDIFSRSFDFDSEAHKGFKGFLLVSLRELRIYRYAWFNFVGTTLSTRYRRSTLGFLWTLLNPLFTMIIISVVFSTLFKTSFADFSLYLFSGQMAWTFISNSIIFGASSIVSAEGYLKKVYVPKLIFPLSIIGVEVINFLFSFLGLSLLAFFLGVKPTWTWLLMPFVLALTAFYLLGIILIVSCVNVYFRDLAHILQILFLGLFYLIPIIYRPEFLTDRLLMIIKLNPFYYFIDLFHSIIYFGVLPAWDSLLPCLALALVSMLTGLYIFSINEKDLIYRL